MTQSTMSTDELNHYNYAYIPLSSTFTTATLIHYKIPENRAVTKFRRPRTKFSSKWINIPGRTCRCQQATVYCALEGPEHKDKDIGNTKQKSKEQWFSGLQVWLRLKPGEDEEENKSLQSDEDYEKDSVYIDSGQKKSKKIRYWPWQNSQSVEEDKEDTRRKVRHNDPKPGANVNGNVKEITTFQDNLKKMLSIVAPNMKNKQSKQLNEDQDDNTVSSIEANGTHSSEAEEDTQNKPIESKQNGISELYKPPAEFSVEPNSEQLKQTTKSEGAKENWFKIPWERKEVVEENNNRSKPDSRGRPSVEKPVAKEITIIELPDRESGTEYDGTTKERRKEIRESEAETNSRHSNVDAEKTEHIKNEIIKKEISSIMHAAQTTSPKSHTNLIDIVSIPQKDVAAIRLIFGSETFFATETLSPPGGLIFRGNLRGEPKAALAKLEERLAARLGDKYTLCLAEGEEDLRPVVVVVPTARDQRPASARQKLMAFVVAIMTFTTCAIKGAYTVFLWPTKVSLYGHPPPTSIFNRLFYQPVALGAAIAVSIGCIIILSQMVQRFVASRHKTRIAIPFFLPSYQLGCFGAVVQIASPTPTRAALFDIALSGAATLVLASLACLLIGLRISTSFPSVLPVPMSITSGSLLVGFLTQQFPNGQILVDYNRSLIGLHPLAVIGANCLTVAALNLLPIRQLDGGRIISALYGRKTAVLASRVTILFLLLASSKNPYFIVFLAAITFGPWSVDRPAKNELTEPNALRTIVGYVFMLIMISVLLPYPACKFFGTL